MKMNIKIFACLLTFVSLSCLVSCSSDKIESQVTSKSNVLESTIASRSLPPPTPGDLRGFYDVTYDTGIEANFVFEYPNYVCYGSPTITDKLALSGFRTNYSRRTGNIYEFSLNDGVITYNYRLEYDSLNSKFSGTYGVAPSYNDKGSFFGKKHFTGTTGFSYLKGYWLGAYGISTGPTNYDYTMVFEENGKVSVAANATLYGSLPASGTYSLIGNIVTGTYTYSGGYVYSFKIDFGNFGNTIYGTWGYGSSMTNGGNFYLSTWNFY